MAMDIAEELLKGNRLALSRAITAIETQIEISKFHLNEILNNFSGSAIINFNGGVPDEETKAQYEKQIRDVSKKIDVYRAYITITENYQDMIEIIAQNPEFTSYANIFRDKYGFDRGQAGLIKLMTVEDLLSVDKYRMEVEKLQEEMKRYREWMDEYSGTNQEYHT